MRGHGRYAWVVVAVGFVALVMSAGFRSTAGVLLVPLHEEFSWSHETIGLAVSLNLLCFGLGAPFAAGLVERFGVRWVVSCALAIIAVSSLLTVGMTEQWQLFQLHHIENRSIQEIALATRKSEDAVKSHLYRARRLLLAR